MVATSVAAYRVGAGRDADFRALAGAYKRYLDTFGGETHWRRTLYGGEMAGELLMVTMHDDALGRAQALDRILADRANNPMVQAMEAANPPGTLLRRSLLNGVGASASAPAPAPPNVLVTRQFTTSEPCRAQAIAALEAARERSERLGLHVLNSQAAGAGPGTGRLLRSARAESMAAVQEFIDRSAAASEPDPLQRALEAGVLTLVTSAISVLYPV
jgi:hypothetical protein